MGIQGWAGRTDKNWTGVDADKYMTTQDTSRRFAKWGIRPTREIQRNAPNVVLVPILAAGGSYTCPPQPLR